MIRLKMSKAPETVHYTMFLTWGKKNCGADFVEKLGNGGVRLVLIDQIWQIFVNAKMAKFLYLATFFPFNSCQIENVINVQIAKY